MQILSRPSPNAGPRRDGARPDMIVLHHTAMRSTDAALERLCDPAAEVSSHYLIAENGRIHALVPEADRAWHAGAGTWGTVTDVNSRSIGIELANAGPLDGFPPFPEPQMRALEALLTDIRNRWSIPPARVIAHSDMAPGRKADPGPKFDWRRLALAGHAVWPSASAAPGENTSPDWSAFGTAAARAGYAAPCDDWSRVLAAFRLRFRPWAGSMPLDCTDVALAKALAAAHPCVDADPTRA